MSRIFISHSNRDNARALEVRAWLAANGWDDVFLDVDPASGLAPGECWQNALKAAADRCEAVLFLVSPNWLKSPWCLSEFLLAKQLGKRLFPLMIDGASIEALPTEISSDHQAVDLIGDPLGWDRLKEGLRRAGLDPNSFPFAKGRRPYPGFEPLTEGDAAIFFGREAQVLRGLDRLRLMRDAGAERMMVVLGASGAGKSSFLRAGFWPRLRRDDRNFLPLPMIRPERAVLTGKAGLFAALEKTLADPGLATRPGLAAFPRSRAALGTLLARADGLAELLAAIRKAATQSFSDSPPPAIVLLIDQAEELLNEEGRTESERFLEILARTLDQQKGLIVVLAIRSDAFPQFQAKPALATVPREPFDLPPMPEGSLRLVIEGPAKLASPPLKLDPALVDALLADSTGQDALPLLAFTLDRLAREYGAAGKLTLDDYHAAGGMRGIVTAAVEEALAQGKRQGLPSTDPAALESLLKQAFIPHLARVNEAGEFARRIAYAHEIPPLAKPVIDLLVEARLLTRDRDSNGETVEVAHEALLREWPLLRGFLEADREFLISKRQIADDLKIWEDAPTQGKGDALLTGLRLTRAQHFLSERSAQDLSDPERAFIGASVKAAESARRRRNVVVAAAIVLLTAFSALAGWQWVDARHEAALAKDNAALAEANEQKAERSANDFRQAKDQAEANARKAETNEARAHSAQVKAEIQESISLADQSLRQAASGDALGAIQRALSALPHDQAQLDRPYVAKADYALAKALLGNRPEAAITPSSDWVNAAAYNRDGSRFAVGTRDGIFKIYDSKTARELASRNERRQAVMSLAYSADGSRVVAAYQDPPSLVLRDGASGNNIRTFRLSALPARVLLTRDGSKAVVVSQQGEPRPAVIDLNDESGNIRFLQSHAKLTGGILTYPRAVALSHDDRLLLYVVNDAVFIWDLEGGSLVAASVEAGPGVRKFDFSDAEKDESIDGGAFLESGDAVVVGKRHVYVVDPRTAAIKSSQTFATDNQWALERGPLLPPTGDKIVFSLDKRTLVTYSLDDWKLIARRELPADINNLAISPDGKLIAASCADFSVRVWAIDSTDPIGVFLGHRERIRGMAFAPDGVHMISYGDQTARLWDLRDAGARLNAEPPGWQIKRVNLRTMVATAEPSEDADRPSVGGSGERVWNIARREFVGSSAINAFLDDGARPQAFSASGKWLAISEDVAGGDRDGRQASRMLADLGREVGAAGAPPIEVGNEHLRVIAIMDTATGKAAQLLIIRNAARSSLDVDFLDDDGVTLGLKAEDYNDGDSKSFGEIWNVKSGRKLFSAAQDGADPKLVYSPESGCAILSTRVHWRDNVTSTWNVSTGRKIVQFDRPLAPLSDAPEVAAQLHRHDRMLLGDDENRPSLMECSTAREIGLISGVAAGADRLLMSSDRHRMLVDGIGAPRTLWDLDASKKLAVVPDHPFTSSTATFSNDDRRIVTRGWENNNERFEVFDGGTGALIKSFPEQDSGQGYYVGLTGNRVALQRSAREIEILQVDSDAPATHISLDSNLHRWRFSDADQSLVTVDEAGILRVWDTRTGARTFELSGLDRIDPLGDAPLKGRHIPLLMADGGAAVLNMPEGKIVWQLPRGHKIVKIQLAPDEKSLVVAESDQISLFGIDSAESIASVPIASGEESYFAFNEPGDRAELFVRVAGGGTGAVHLYDVPGRGEIGRFDGAGMLVMAPQNGELALATEKKLWLRNGRTGALDRQVDFDNPISQIDVDLGGRAVVVLTNDQKVWTVDAGEAAPKLMASLRQKPLWLRFAADPQKLLLYEKSSQATFKDTASGKVLTTFATEWLNKSLSNRWTERLDASGELVAIRSPDNYVRVYRTRDGSQVTELSWDDNKFADVAFSQDAKRLLVVTENGRFSNWGVTESKASASPSLPREYSSFSSVTLRRTPDPSQMLAIDRRGYVDLYSLNTNTAQTFYAGEPEESVNAALSPDGAVLAVIGSGDMLRLWHVSAREILAQVPMPHGYVKTDLQFSDDGRILAVDSRDGTRLIRVPLVGDAAADAAAKMTGSGVALAGVNSSAPQTYRLGVYMRDVSAEMAQVHHLAGKGAEVIEVFPDSAAQASGLRVGDIIVAVNGKPVATAAECSAAVKDVHLDLSLDIVRGTTAMSARAALSD